MKILVTGKNGFVAQNVMKYFSSKGYEVLALSHNDSNEVMENYCSKCDFVIHLAAVQRFSSDEEFYKGNVYYTQLIINALWKANNTVPIIFSSSVLADSDTVFAQTKNKAEQLIRVYSKHRKVPVYIFKLNNIFGPFGKPHFNNVIATFCYNLSNNKPITVTNPSIELQFTYVLDLMYDFEKCITNKSFYSNNDYLTTSIKYKRSLGEVVFLLGKVLNNETINDQFYEKLKETYSSYTV